MHYWSFTRSWNLLGTALSLENFELDSYLVCRIDDCNAQCKPKFVHFCKRSVDCDQFSPNGDACFRLAIHARVSFDPRPRIYWSLQAIQLLVHSWNWNYGNNSHVKRDISLLKIHFWLKVLSKSSRTSGKWWHWLPRIPTSPPRLHGIFLRSKLPDDDLLQNRIHLGVRPRIQCALASTPSELILKSFALLYHLCQLLRVTKLVEELCSIWPLDPWFHRYHWFRLCSRLHNHPYFKLVECHYQKWVYQLLGLECDYPSLHSDLGSPHSLPAFCKGYEKGIDGDGKVQRIRSWWWWLQTRWFRWVCHRYQ